MVLLVGLVFLAEEFGLEVVLGAFLAGAMVSLLDRDEAMERLGGEGEAGGDRLRRLRARPSS